MMNASWIKLMTLLLAVQALTAGMAQAQQVPLVPLKPLKDVLEPAAQLRGTWWNEEPQRGREHFTFGEKDELLVVSPQQQRDRMEYRLDTSKTPWKLILTVKRGEATGTIYAAIEFPAENQMRMSRAVLDEKQLPNAAQLKENGVLFHRVLWPQHGGIFQAVEAHLKGLEGTWQGITEIIDMDRWVATKGAEGYGE